MKKRYLALLAALTILVTGTSCGSEDSSAGSGSSAAEAAVSNADDSSAADTASSAAGTASAPDESSGDASKAPADELPAMESAYKVLSCLDAEGRPDAIRSCGNIVALSCYTVDNDGQRSVKYYIIDAANDKLLRTIEAENSREILLGTDAGGGLTAEIWKDWINETDDLQQLVFYKPDGTRSAIEYNDDLSFLFYYPPAQLCDLSKGVAKIGTDGSREVIFDNLAAEESWAYDPSRNRAVTAYLAESFTEPTTLMLTDTSTGKEIAELKAAHVIAVGGAGDYAVVSCVPDYETYDVYTSVYEMETGKLLWTCSEKQDESTNWSCYNDCSYGLSYKYSQGSEPLTLKILRVSDGATGTLTVDIPDASYAFVPTVTVGGRFVSAVTVEDAATRKTSIRLVMTDPAQVSFDGSVEKCDPYNYQEKNNKCGDKYSDLRARADKLEEKYGVKILIGDEVLDLEDTNDPYRFPSTEGDEADGNSYRDTENGLASLESHLAEYPEGFFEQFRINGKAGLCIGLVESLVDKYSDTAFEAGGVTYGYGLWTVIAIRADAVGYALDHEMFHAVEFIVSEKVGEIDEDEWAALNPEGFVYSTSFDGYAESDTGSEYVYPADSDPYFYREYGKVTPLEDRATLIEGLINNTESMTYIRDIKEKCPHLKAKYDFLADWTKQLFGYVYWEKMLGIGL